MVSALNPGFSGSGLSPGQDHCVVFLGKILYAQCLSPHRIINGYRQIAVIVVICGLTYKSGEGSILVCIDPLAAFAGLYKQKTI